MRWIRRTSTPAARASVVIRTSRLTRRAGRRRAAAGSQRPARRKGAWVLSSRRSSDVSIARSLASRAAASS